MDVAESNRIYPKGTADGYRAAINLFAAELNEEERESLDILSDRLEKIYQAVINKNKANIKIQTLATYRTRVKKVLNEYTQFGQDPSKMANWNRKGRNRIVKDRKETLKSEQTVENIEPATMPFTQMNRVELSLRPEMEMKSLILLPFDLRRDEAHRIKVLIDAMVQPETDPGKEVG